jgi:multidrug efflux pump subunit AcrB
MERAPVESRGRIFSVLLLLTNVAAIVPLMFLGGAADLLGINLTIGIVAAIVLAVAVASIWSSAAAPELESAPGASDQSSPRTRSS